MNNPVRLVPCSPDAYTEFAAYHYDKEVFQKSAMCWVAFIGDKQVGFCAAIARTGRRGKDLRPFRDAHKTVAKLPSVAAGFPSTHPAYFKLWSLISDKQGETMLKLGFRFWSTAPADHASYRDASPLWKASSNDGVKEGYRSHQYVGKSWNRTISGQPLFGIYSALHGEIRRGMEYAACQHAMQMEGRPDHRKGVWNLLEQVIATEEIGLANPNAVGRIQEYRLAYERARKTNNNNHPETLSLVLAVSYLCRSPKSRIVDNLIHAIRGETKLGIVPPPEVSCTDTLTEPPEIDVTNERQHPLILIVLAQTSR